MRQAKVYYEDKLAGIISESDDGYWYTYDQEYLNSEAAKPISLTMPLQETPFESKILFPFFDGLIPEGWLLEIAVNNWKINPRDRFGLLITLCRDCIGCISVVP